MLLPLVDAHLPAPSLPAQHAAPGPRPRNLEPAQLCLTPPDPKGPSFTSSPRNPRRFTYCAAISGFSTLNPGPNLRKRSTQPRPPTPTRSHRRPSVPAGVSKVVCCDIWIFGRVWDPICEISQHSTRQTTQPPNHRSVTWFTNQFDAPQPPGMCAAILPVLGPDSPPGGRYRSTLL